MIYCFLKGGLCNLYFQIATAIAFAKEKNTEAAFPNLHHQLNYLNLETNHNPKLNYAQEYLKIFTHVSVEQPQPHFPVYRYPFHYDPFVPENNSIIDGFFQTEKYFKKYKQDILNFFKPKEDLQQEINLILNQLPKEFNAIHVRLGDYLKSPGAHNNLPLSYFLKSINTINSNLPYVIFSDDIDLCKTYFSENNFIFLNNKDYIDLYVMSYAQNYILSNSSFSWWGAWLNQNSKIVIAPPQWFGPDLHYHNTSDIIPEYWLTGEL